MMNLSDISIATAARTRLAQIEIEFNSLAYEQVEIETFLRVHDRFADPQAGPLTQSAGPVSQPASNRPPTAADPLAGEKEDQPITNAGERNAPEQPEGVDLPLASGAADVGEPAQPIQKSTAVRKDAPNQNAGGHGAVNAIEAGTQAPPVDTMPPAVAEAIAATIDGIATDEQVEAVADAVIGALVEIEAMPGEDAAVAHAQLSPLVPIKTTREQQIRDVLAEHPDWRAGDIARHLGCPVSTVTGTASLKGIVLPKAPAALPPKVQPAAAASGQTLTDRVRRVHQQHPTWTARMLAAELGAKESSVSSILGTVLNDRVSDDSLPPGGVEAALKARHVERRKRLGAPS